MALTTNSAPPSPRTGESRRGPGWPPAGRLWGLNRLLLGAWLAGTAFAIAFAFHVPHVKQAPSFLEGVSPDGLLPRPVLSVAAPEGLWRIGEHGVQRIGLDLRVENFADEEGHADAARSVEQLAWSHGRLALVRGGRLALYVPGEGRPRDVLRADLDKGKLGPLDLRAPVCPSDACTQLRVAPRPRLHGLKSRAGGGFVVFVEALAEGRTVIRVDFGDDGIEQARVYEHHSTTRVPVDFRAIRWIDHSAWFEYIDPANYEVRYHLVAGDIDFLFNSALADGRGYLPFLNLLPRPGEAALDIPAGLYVDEFVVAAADSDAVGDALLPWSERVNANGAIAAEAEESIVDPEYPGWQWDWNTAETRNGDGRMPMRGGVSRAGHHFQLQTRYYQHSKGDGPGRLAWRPAVHCFGCRLALHPIGTDWLLLDDSGQPLGSAWKDLVGGPDSLHSLDKPSLRQSLFVHAGAPRRAWGHVLVAWGLLSLLIVPLALRRARRQLRGAHALDIHAGTLRLDPGVILEPDLRGRLRARMELMTSTGRVLLPGEIHLLRGARAEPLIDGDAVCVAGRLRNAGGDQGGAFRSAGASSIEGAPGSPATLLKGDVAAFLEEWSERANRQLLAVLALQSLLTAALLLRFGLRALWW